MQRQIPPSSKPVEIFQLCLSLWIKMTPLLLAANAVQLHHINQAERAKLVQLERLKSDQTYELCIAAAQQVSLDSPYRLQASILADQCQNLATAAALSRAQQQMRDWQADWSNNQAHWQVANLALSAQQPQLALTEIQKITHPYWRQQAQLLIAISYAQPQLQSP